MGAEGAGGAGLWPWRSVCLPAVAICRDTKVWISLRGLLLRKVGDQVCGHGSLFACLRWQVAGIQLVGNCREKFDIAKSGGQVCGHGANL